MQVSVSGLFLYPIKGCHGITVSSAVVEAQGLRWDRRWMLVDAETGGFLSQRSHPTMARITVAIDPSGTLTVTGDGSSFVLPRLPDTELEPRTVSVWAFTGEARDCGTDAAVFFSDVVQHLVRLVRVPDNFTRRVNPKFAVTPEDTTGFADAYPILVTTEASLADLNSRLQTPLPMNRFRPNMVLSGDFPAWAEDAWTRLQGDTDICFHAVKPCDRCAVPTIDQESGAKTGPEPLATLARFRRDPETGKVYFGMNLIPDTRTISQTISVGDSFTIS